MRHLRLRFLEKGSTSGQQNRRNSTAFGRALALASLAVLVFVPSCVHEYPIPGQEVDPTIINLTIELSTDPSITAASVFSKSEDLAPYVQFIVEFYYRDPNNGGYVGEALDRWTQVVPKDEHGIARASFEGTYHAGAYRMAAFATHVLDEQGTGIAYNVSDLGAITYLSETYEGSTDIKECYDARADIDLSPAKWFADTTISAVLSSPMGRVEVVSEDAKQFVTKLLGMSAEVDLVAQNQEFWDGYEVRWDYSLYFPTGYNVLSGQANRADLGIWFNTGITTLSDEEALLGYDYVFVNGESTSIGITLRVYDVTTGTLLNTYGGLMGDIYKGETTVIRGNFLTTEQGSGIGIDPGFTDTINIVLPD